MTCKYSSSQAKKCYSRTDSRVFPAENSHIELDLQIHLAHFGAGKLQEPKEKTGRDPTLTDLRGGIVTGWPEI